MKKLIYIVPLVLLFCFTIACQDKAAMAELEKYKAQAKVEEQNKEVVRNFFAAIDKNDFAKLKELSSDDFALYAPGLAEPWGLDGIFQAIKAHYASFPDWKHKIEEIIAEESRVAVKLVQNGTHKVAYEGILPTDKNVIEPAQCLFVVVNGKVKEFWVIEDSLGFYRQLGMELKPIAAKKK
jgi:predicted ester cyclase